MRAFDVVVCGGGPAGAASAIFLRRAGLGVLLLEKERFPRFHIGESLLPAAVPILHGLGIAPQQHFLSKHGARFVIETAGGTDGERREMRYDFADAMGGTPDHAFQVERAHLDQLLLRRAACEGVEVVEGARVRKVGFSSHEAVVASDAGEHVARYVVDATGSAALLGRRQRTLVPLRGMGRAAVFQHFFGLAEPTARFLGQTGDIYVFVRPEGWVWAIPLRGRRLSVGAVVRDGVAREACVGTAIAESPLLRRWVRGATCSPPRAVGSFSFRNRTQHGSRFVCVGDAGCFLDPVFSSGVTMALLAAERASARIVAAMARGDEADPVLQDPVMAELAAGYGLLQALILRFYGTKMVDNLFFAAAPDVRLRAGLVAILAGDLWRDDNPFARLLGRSRRLQQVV